MNLGEKIQYCRKKARMSQDALADKIGVSRQAISKWELGEAMPEIANLATLAKEFGVSVDWLISEDGEEKTTEQKEDYGKKYESFFDTRLKWTGKMLKRYGWLMGLYPAICGLGVTIIGILAKIALSAMFGSFSQTITSIGPMDPALPNIVTNNPVSIIANVFIVIGVIMMIGGAILAVYLKKIGRK